MYLRLQIKDYIQNFIDVLLYHKTKVDLQAVLYLKYTKFLSPDEKYLRVRLLFLSFNDSELESSYKSYPYKKLCVKTIC